MPRRARSAIPATLYHVMNRSFRSVPLFTGRREYVAFLDVLSEGLSQHAVELIVYCLMPNHWHLVLRLEQPRELSRFMHWVTATHAARWHRRRGTVGLGSVYKGRFLSVAIESEGALVRVCRYVERNPLRAGLVLRAQEWPWSSLAERGRARPRVPLLSAPFLGGDGWMAHVNLAATLEGESAIERLETTGARRATGGDQDLV